MSICLSIGVCLSIYRCLSVCLSVCLSIGVCLSVCLFIGTCLSVCRSVRMAERLVLPTSDHGVAGSSHAGGEILTEPKQLFIAQSLSCSPFHRLEMAEILLKGRKTLTHPSICLSVGTWLSVGTCLSVCRYCLYVCRYCLSVCRYLPACSYLSVCRCLSV